MSTEISKDAGPQEEQKQEPRVSSVRTNVMNRAIHESRHGKSPETQNFAQKTGNKFMGVLRFAKNIVVAKGPDVLAQEARDRRNDPIDKIDSMENDQEMKIQIPVKKLGKKTTLDVATDNGVQVSHNLSDNVQAALGGEGASIAYTNKSANEKEWQMGASAGVDYEGNPKAWFNAVKKF